MLRVVVGRIRISGLRLGGDHMRRMSMIVGPGLFLLVIAVVLGVTSHRSADAEPPKGSSVPEAHQKAGDRDELLAARDKLRNSTDKVRTFRAREALAEIEKNIALLRVVRTKVEGAKNIDTVIDEVADAMDSMASSYEAIGGMRRDIELAYKAEFRTVDDVTSGTRGTLAEIRAEKARCESEIPLSEQRLPTVLNPNERKKLEIRIRSLKSQVGQWTAKETIWVRFEEAQRTVKDKLSISGEQVDMLIFLLEENAKVYRGAASVARLRKSAKETLSNFVDFQDLNAAAGSLEGTWSELDGIVDRMAADDFLIGAGQEK